MLSKPKLAKVVSVALEPKPRLPGRPKKTTPLSDAERARRYREKQKAAGLSKQYVSMKDAGSDQQTELAYWIADSKRLGELLRTTKSEHDFLKSQVQRLQQENDMLLDRAKEAERFTTNCLKDLIVTRHELAELRRQSQ